MLFANYCFYQTLMFCASSMSFGMNFFFFLAILTANQACCCCCSKIFLSLQRSFSNCFYLIFSYFRRSLSNRSLSFYFSRSSFLSFTGFDSGPAIRQKYRSNSLVSLRNYSLAELNKYEFFIIKFTSRQNYCGEAYLADFNFCYTLDKSIGYLMIQQYSGMPRRSASTGSRNGQEFLWVLSCWSMGIIGLRVQVISYLGVFFCGGFWVCFCCGYFEV